MNKGTNSAAVVLTFTSPPLHLCGLIIAIYLCEHRCVVAAFQATQGEWTVLQSAAECRAGDVIR